MTNLIYTSNTYNGVTKQRLTIDRETKGIIDPSKTMELDFDLLWTGCDYDFSSFHDNLAYIINSEKLLYLSNNYSQYRDKGSFLWSGYENITQVYTCGYFEYCQIQGEYQDKIWKFKFKKELESDSSRALLDLVCTKTKPNLLFTLNYFGPNRRIIWINRLFWSTSRFLLPIYLEYPGESLRKRIYEIDSDLVPVQDAIIGFTEFSGLE